METLILQWPHFRAILFRLYLNGSKTQWEYIRRQIIGLDCYYGYETEIIQGIWCWESKKRQGWGCKQLSEIKTHYNPHEYRDFVYWFDFGHFITDNIWQINKKELLKILKREAELKRLDLCPLFDFNNITKTVKNLPDQIDLSVDSNWEKIDINEFDGESKTISIRPTSDSCGWS